MSWLSALRFIGIAILLILLHFFGILNVMEQPIISLIGSTASRINTFQIAARQQIGSSPDSKDLRACLEQRDAALKENAELIIARSENETLRKMLHFTQGTAITRVGATVIGFSADTSESSIIIDKGRVDGIQEERAVITDDGILIGKTRVVSDHISHVLLLTDNRSKIIGTILAKKQATGIVSGEFQIGLKMDLIPITVKIARNNLVVTAGLEEGIPSGLLVGTISEIKTRPTDFYQTASLRPLLNYSDVRLVSVIDSSVQ